MKRVVGSGIVVVVLVFPKLFLVAKMSAKFVVPSWFESPVVVFEPKLFAMLSMSVWFTRRSLFVSPWWRVKRSMSLPSPEV